eukprot:4270065-Prymnesium_polylepis.1
MQHCWGGAPGRGRGTVLRFYTRPADRPTRSIKAHLAHRSLRAAACGDRSAAAVLPVVLPCAPPGCPDVQRPRAWSSPR